MVFLFSKSRSRRIFNSGSLGVLFWVLLGCGSPSPPPASAEKSSTSAQPEPPVPSSCDELAQYIDKHFPDDTRNPAADQEAVTGTSPARIVSAKKAKLAYPAVCETSGQALYSDAEDTAAYLCADKFFPPNTLGFYVNVKEICPDAPTEWWRLEFMASSQLKEWKEPSFLKTSDRAEVTYRLLLMPDKEVSTVVRVEKNDKGAFLISKQCTCGDAREREDAVQYRKLLPSQWKRITELLDRVGFWELPAQVSRVKPGGATWIIEGRDAERHQVVARSEPEVGFFKRIGELLITLAGLEEPDSYCCLIGRP